MYFYNFLLTKNKFQLTKNCFILHGPKLESLARIDQAKRSVEEIAELIVDLDHSGKISTERPKELVQVLEKILSVRREK